MSRIAIRLLSCVCCIPMIHSAAIGETLITFDGLVNGQVVTNQFAGVGLTISAINDGSGPDVAVTFDSSLTGTSDAGLEGPAPKPWSAGNINENEVLGNLLIIQANDDISGGVAADPESASGEIFLEFSTPITSFGFDAIDIDPGDANLSSVKFYRNGVQVGPTFNGLALQGLDPSLEAGNNSANRILDITAAQLGVSDFDGVKFTMDRCTIAVDNLRFNLVPEAGSMSLMAIGACTLLGYGFRRSRQGKAA